MSDHATTMYQLESMITLIDGGGLKQVAEHRADYVAMLHTARVGHKADVEGFILSDLKQDTTEGKHYTKALAGQLADVEKKLAAE